jgi:HAD superfamily hydrolase (TIGR01509 family)
MSALEDSMLLRPLSGAYRAALFDMDGVIVDTAEAVEQFWQQIAQRHGVRLSDEEIARCVHGRPARGVLDALFPWLDDTQREEVHALMREYEAADTYQEIPGAIQFITSLRRNGIATALVTSGEPAKVETVLRQLGLEGMFDSYITADDVRLGKPDPECYLLAARRLKVRPEDCVVFEDAVSGVRAAVAAGAACIGVAEPLCASELTAEGAMAIVSNFAEVSFENCVSDDMRFEIALDFDGVALAFARNAGPSRSEGRRRLRARPVENMEENVG